MFPLSREVQKTEENDSLNTRERSVKQPVCCAENKMYSVQERTLTTGMSQPKTQFEM